MTLSPDRTQIEDVPKVTKMGLRRGFPFIIAILTCLGVAPAFADMTVLTYNTRFCPSWAEAHERSLADPTMAVRLFR